VSDVPPAELPKVQVVAVKLLDVDAAAAVQLLVAVGPVVTVLQFVATKVFAAVGTSTVQDATPTAALAMLLVQVVWVQLLPVEAGVVQLDPALAVQLQLATGVGLVVPVWQVTVGPPNGFEAKQLDTPTKPVSVVWQVIVFPPAVGPDGAQEAAFTQPGSTT
jgi:hypothetical protein